MSTSLSSPSAAVLTPTVFVRHHRQLRALLLERQAWFVGSDLARLTNSNINERITNKLDPDQTRKALLPDGSGNPEAELLISESGVYTLLMVHLYHPENRQLRQWLSNEVVPVLRDAQLNDPALPRRRFGQALGRELGVMEWQGSLWVRASDVLRVLEAESPAAAAEST